MEYKVPRCRVVPEAGHQASFIIDGKERTRWHYGPEYPRPFLYPVNGPSGETLTRMGHPGAPNHDHHRSVWFAHHDVEGMSFWTESTPTEIRQKQWLAYEDGEEECRMATGLGWYDGHEPTSLIDQEVVISVRPGEDSGDETLIEIQSRFLVKKGQIEFRKTNFGLLAVRVAANISNVFGGGILTGADQVDGEKVLFGKPNQWMDYSGPVASGGTEGVTYLDHPSNPGYPNHWHVRNDGWMGNAPCLQSGITVTPEKPLMLRYLLYLHKDSAPVSRIAKVEKAFHQSGAYKVVAKPKPHHHYGIKRV